MDLLNVQQGLLWSHWYLFPSLGVLKGTPVSRNSHFMLRISLAAGPASHLQFHRQARESDPNSSLHPTAIIKMRTDGFNYPTPQARDISGEGRSRAKAILVTACVVAAAFVVVCCGRSGSWSCSQLPHAFRLSPVQPVRLPEIALMWCIYLFCLIFNLNASYSGEDEVATVTGFSRALGALTLMTKGLAGKLKHWGSMP